MLEPNPLKIDAKIVIFCGGRGSGELANQLLDSGADVTCCVNAYDDGLSTGRLRQMFDVLGPSDIRKNLLSLMDLDALGYWSRFEVFSFRYAADEENAPKFRREIEVICEGDPKKGAAASSEFSRILERTSPEFQDRITRYLRTFLSGLVDAEKNKNSLFSFSDCAIGNCVLIGALIENGNNWIDAIEAIEKLLITRGRVELVSVESRHLFAVCKDGRVLASEAAVIAESDGDIVDIFLTEQPVDPEQIKAIIEKEGIEKAVEIIRATIASRVTATEQARTAIAEADTVIYGSGTFYSSILPTLMIPDVRSAIKANSNPKTMILNIVEEADTRGFNGIDLVRGITDLLGTDAIQTIAVNMPSIERGEQYFTLSERELSEHNIAARIVKGDLESRTRPGRHDPMLLVNTLNAANAGEALTEPNPLPLVSVLMLAWNRKDEVEIGLREMRKLNYPNVEFVVVDNGSVDGTAQMVYENFPEANVVRLHKNTGMTGYNVGLATARGKYVIMLDDDSHLAPDAVSKMVKIWELDENQDVGAMAFRVINPINGSLVTHLWEERLGEVEPGREREITSFAACGAAVRRDMLDEVGYFDDDFFLYATEDDLSIRIWDAGHKIVYEPRCLSYHRESGLMRNWKRYGFGFRNATWFNIKHLPLHLLPLMFVRNMFWLVTRSIHFSIFTMALPVY
jgi:GT2 family glycosyltransferase/2-phospho-L-lactate transferase/gluconeogenesis factor (CofD/UPF0052 family)